MIQSEIHSINPTLTLISKCEAYSREKLYDRKPQMQPPNRCHPSHNSAEEMQNVFGPAIGELMAAIAAQNLAPAGPVFAHHLKMPPDIFDFELGVPVGAPIAATRGVRPRQRPAMKVARTSSNRRTTTATLRGEGLGREINYYVCTILRSVLRDDNGGLIIALHLRLSLDDARKPAANLPDAKNTRRTGGRAPEPL